MNENFKYVVCLDNSGYPASLERHKIYRVIPDSVVEADDEIRILDESGEDYIYSAHRFVAVKLPLAVEESFLKAA